MKYKIAVLLFSFILVFTACENEKYIYNKTQNVNPEGWVYPDTLDFSFDIKDTSKLYSILMDINHSTDYNYQNIYMNISTTFPSGKYLHQRISSDFADKTGKWHGKCSAKNCTAPINLQEKAKFNETGKYNITIAQFSRDSALKEINGITLKLKEYESLK